MHVSKLPEFIHSHVLSNTVFEKLENWEELETQYSQALARSTYVQSDSHRILFTCVLPFLYR